MFLNIFCLHERECIFCFVEHVGILRGQWMVFVGCRHVFYKLQLKSDRCFWLTRAWVYFTSVRVFVLNFVRVLINVLPVPHKMHTRTTWLPFLSCWYLRPTRNITKQAGRKILSNWLSFFLAFLHSNTVPQCLWFMAVTSRAAFVLSLDSFTM